MKKENKSAFYETDVFPEDGFTIIELLIVVMIAVIVTSIAIPAIQDVMPVYRVNSGARMVASHLQWTRMQAVTNNSNYTVTFNTASNKYTITGAAVNREERLPKGVRFGYAGTPASVIAGGVGAGPIESPEGTSVSAISFLPTGSLTNSVGIYLIPKQDMTGSGRMDRMRALKVTGSTGAITIYSYQNSAWKR